LSATDPERGGIDVRRAITEVAGTLAGLAALVYLTRAARLVVGGKPSQLAAVRCGPAS
jgi:hypothetical protein